MNTEQSTREPSIEKVTAETTSKFNDPETNKKLPEASSADTSSVPRSNCSFKISEELFRKAKKADPGSPESYWSHVLYRGPPQDGVEQKVKVHYCTSKHKSEEVLQRHFLGKKRIGFDLEWKPNVEYKAGVKQNVSLVQLACDGRIALLHIALFTDAQIECPPTLRKILEDSEVTKIGVAIKADCTRFHKLLQVKAKSLFELSHLYKLVKYSELKDYKQINKKLVPLAQQVEEHLHLPLFKGSDVRASDWSQKIQYEQIVYAAADAYAGLQLFETMDYKRKELEPSPPCPYHIDENKPIRLADGVDIAVDEIEETLPEEPIVTTPARYNGRRQVPHGAIESIELDTDFELLENPAKAQGNASTVKAPEAFNSPIVLAADTKVNDYRRTHLNSRTYPSILRAYFIWHENPNLSIENIAALLREKPLQPSTVKSYILEAVRLEQLPYDKSRLRAVLEPLPKSVWYRYRPLARAVGLET